VQSGRHLYLTEFDGSARKTGFDEPSAAGLLFLSASLTWRAKFGHSFHRSDHEHCVGRHWEALGDRFCRDGKEKQELQLPQRETAHDADVGAHSLSII